MDKEMQMAKKILLFACCVSVASTAIILSSSMAKPRPLSLPENQKAVATSQASQKTFASPKEAADALVEAAAGFDTHVLQEILGPGSEDLIASEDAVQDKNRAAEFVAKAREQSSVKTDPKHPNRAVLLIGTDNWPLPIPIVKRVGKWLFDAKEGR